MCNCMNSQEFEVTTTSLMLNQIKDTHKKYSLNKRYQHKENHPMNFPAEIQGQIWLWQKGMQQFTNVHIEIQNATLRLVQDEQFPN